ncbi:hypothetical protein [Novosphingobium lindaniclasticum]|uniref:PilZ domain-containing protein n=1 Tax=Novosphingobium lindaniclasticum LE124 TaxID=1096930 RepID=T0HYA8_9SPHN|nr:hypothetical protein [Novosphingobium lindaniclasticum]EQB18077.1 hypothetical protein L284_05960 [Novosphingobium lindaniclasticum LE124]
MAREMPPTIYISHFGTTESELAKASLLPPRHVQPRAPRQRTLIAARLLRVGTPEHAVIVRNVSVRGALHRDVPLPGEIVAIRLPENVEHLAEVRWTDDREFGVELFSTLDVEKLGAANRRRHRVFLDLMDASFTAPMPVTVVARL